MSNKFAIVYSAFFVKSSDRLIINRWNSNYDDVASQLSSELHYSIKTLLDSLITGSISSVTHFQI